MCCGFDKLTLKSPNRTTLHIENNYMCNTLYTLIPSELNVYYNSVGIEAYLTPYSIEELDILYLNI